jgi:3-polyprenyl-4-hydroxybenzoate decarboxylase
LLPIVLIFIVATKVNRNEILSKDMAVAQSNDAYSSKRSCSTPRVVIPCSVRHILKINGGVGRKKEQLKEEVGIQKLIKLKGN